MTLRSQPDNSGPVADMMCKSQSPKPATAQDNNCSGHGLGNGTSVGTALILLNKATRHARHANCCRLLPRADSNGVPSYSNAIAAAGHVGRNVALCKSEVRRLRPPLT